MTSAVENASEAEVRLAQAQRRLLWSLGAAVFMVNLDARLVAPLLPTARERLVRHGAARAGRPRTRTVLLGVLLEAVGFKLMFLLVGLCLLAFTLVTVHVLGRPARVGLS